jgi:glutathione S-transferase
MKGLAYQVDPIVLFFGDDRFSELNPLRRVPVFIDDQVSVNTVICECLEERYPRPALLPKPAAERARARWMQKFPDTRIGDVFIWRVCQEAVVSPFIWQRPRDKAKIARAVAHDRPALMARAGAPGTGIGLPVRGRLQCGYLGRRILSQPALGPH